MGMNEYQQKVINHGLGPAVVLAGAGSGKTSTLINRIQRLSKAVDPKRIVMLTFTNTAANEMKSRAAKINKECERVVALTYHSYCSMMLRKYGKAIGIESSFEVLTGMSYKTLIEYVKSSSEYYETLKDFPSASKLDTIFSRIINTNASVASCIFGTNYSQYEEEITNLFNEVKKYGFENQKFNFDDLLVYMNNLLDNPDICHKIATSFDYLMVDEFQDTNRLQLSILFKLSKYNRNIVIVGDVSQSIYKFRGAEVKNIQDFIDYFEDCDVYTLSINYRSTQEILDATNDMMNNNVFSWTYTNMVSNDKNGSKPLIVQHETSDSQAQWIISKINSAVDSGYDLSQIAIIERKSMSSFKLENELLRCKIPFEKRGGRKFTEYACVDDMLSFISVLVKPKDKFGWFRILKLIPSIGNKTSTTIANSCEEDNFLDKYSKRKFYNNLLELQNNLNDYRSSLNDVTTLLDKIKDYYFGLREAKIEVSKMSSSAKFDAREKIKNDRKIVDILNGMAVGYTSAIEFLSDMALDAVKTQDDPDDHLIITTIHSAKGLEWPIVIIIDSVESDSDDTEEELRCQYVAMTRAEDELIISYPIISGYKNGIPIYNDLSHFLTNSLDNFVCVEE